jgi:integral membrane protein
VKPGVLTFYRIMAYVTAVLLIALCVMVALKYLGPEQMQPFGRHWTMIIGIAHGYLYLLYLAVALVVTVRLRVPLGRMLLVLLAGTVPFGAFVAERKVTRWYQLRLGGLAIVDEQAESVRSNS